MEWSIRNGAFIGFRLIHEQAASVTGFKAAGKAPKECWLPFAIDLRQVTHIGQPSEDEHDLCDLFNGPNWIATVNAPATSLMGEWCNLLHAFERIPSTHEGRQAVVLAAIEREAIPTDKPRKA